MPLHPTYNCRAASCTLQGLANDGRAAARWSGELSVIARSAATPVPAILRTGTAICLLSVIASLRSDLPIDRSGDCRAATCTLQGLVTAGLRRAGRETSAIGGVQTAATPTVVFSVTIGCRRGLASDHEEPLYLEQVVRSNSWRHDYSLSS